MISFSRMTILRLIRASSCLKLSAEALDPTWVSESQAWTVAATGRPFAPLMYSSSRASVLRFGKRASPILGAKVRFAR